MNMVGSANFIWYSEVVGSRDFNRKERLEGSYNVLVLLHEQYNYVIHKQVHSSSC